MNLLEAIQGAGENWFRPVTWPEIGGAFENKNGVIIHHWKDGESYQWFPANDRWILCEWEIVTPEQVLSERKL